MNAKKAYKYSSDKEGEAFIQEVDIHSILCVDYDAAPESAFAESTTSDAVVLEGAYDLQSLPGAAGCIMLDFDGQYVSGTYWNSGNPINAAPAGMSDAQIQEFWELVSEDYRPFNVNVTTSEAVFNTYPRYRRMRCIITPTNTAAPGAGGVAYIGSFAWDDDTPCWVFMTDSKVGGEAASHEVGHTFGLGHDGRINPAEEYFLGHADWAPIMGASYYVNVSQWSRGEYAYANNFQDDMAIIASSTYGVGYRGDDHSNNISGATPLTIESNGNVPASNYGVITTAGDWDFFSFYTSGGNITLYINTVSRHGDLDLVVRLYEGGGAQIGQWNPSGLNATVTASLGAGTYYIAVDGIGMGDPATNGYSDYASVGSYWITGYIPPVSGVTGLGGTYTLQNRYSGKNLEVDGGQIGQDGANVQQWAATSGNNQKFQLIEVNTGVYRIMNVESGKCVDISGVSTANGANVHQWTYVGGSNQHFKAVNAGGGYYKFVATHSNKLIEVGGFSTSDGGNVQQWEDAGQQTGQWSLNPANNNSGPLANGTYVIQNRYSGLYLDVDANTINQDGANVQQWQLYNTTNQKFTIANLGGDTYSIISVASGKSLDVSGASTANGANIQQWAYVAVPQQQFNVVPVDGSYYKIIATHSNKLVEVGGFNTSNGGNIQQWEDAGQQTGHWQFIAAAKSAFSQLSEEEVIEDIEIYPNPVSSRLYIKGVSSDASIEIFNTLGQKVLEDKGEQINIEVLNSGIYYLKINSDNQLVTRTFIKN